MKNIKRIRTIASCISCGIRGYFCEASMGRCGPSCPCCGNRHFLDWSDSAEYRNQFDVGDVSDMRNRYLYCKDCGIIFELGCLHYASDMVTSDDNVHNAHLIRKWKHRQTDEAFYGMPYFNNPEDWFKNVNDVVVIESYCPNKNAVCRLSRCPCEGVCPLASHA
jgi:hypothetical protein